LPPPIAHAPNPMQVIIISVFPSCFFSILKSIIIHFIYCNGDFQVV
jgi:hypothetical protein